MTALECQEKISTKFIYSEFIIFKQNDVKIPRLVVKPALLGFSPPAWDCKVTFDGSPVMGECPTPRRGQVGDLIFCRGNDSTRGTANRQTNSVCNVSAGIMCAERYSILTIITKVNGISPVVMINECFEVWRVRFELVIPQFNLFIVGKLD